MTKFDEALDLLSHKVFNFENSDCYYELIEARLHKDPSENIAYILKQAACQ